MHVNMAGIAIGAVVVTLWSVLWLYCRRCERWRRRWQARWDEFAAQQLRAGAGRVPEEGRFRC